MTTTPIAIRKMRDALDSIEAEIENSMEQAENEGMDISSDFALEALLDFYSADQIPELGILADEFLEFLSRFCNIA